MKNGEYHTQPKSIHRKKCESKQREIYHWRVERNGNVENRLFYSHLLRTDKLPGDITGIFALLLAIPPLYRYPSTSYLTTLLRAHLHLHTQIPGWGSPQSPAMEKSLW